MSQQVPNKSKNTEKKDSRQTRTVQTATREEADQVIDALVMAFASDPVVRWFYPNPHDYLEHFPELLDIYGGKAFDHGTANYVENFTGSALWLPPEVHPEDEQLAELLQNTMPEDRCEVALAAFEDLEQYHPDEPHWHLPAIGVQPTQQRKGFGSALLEQRLAACDEQDVPVYLESTNPGNVSLYLRHGFEILDTIERGTMPPFIPMVRHP